MQIPGLDSGFGHDGSPAISQWAQVQGLSFMSDDGCQSTSRAFMEACNALAVEQVLTSYNNSKGNADTERVMRTL
jgi:transposase InsO family protein